MIITLTASELRFAAMVEIERRVENLSLARRNRYGAPADDWGIGIEGAAAELAFAKYLGVYWSGAIGNLRAKDVGQVQVRSTKHPQGCLLLHPADLDDDVFVLAVGLAPAFRFAGWLRGRNGKRRELWRDPGTGRPAFFVPQHELRRLPEVRRPAASTLSGPCRLPCISGYSVRPKPQTR